MIQPQPQPQPPAVAQGGPMDGSRLGTSGGEEFQVTMADGSRHRYVRSDTKTDGGLLYKYAGRV